MYNYTFYLYINGKLNSAISSVASYATRDKAIEGAKMAAKNNTHIDKVIEETEDGTKVWYTHPETGSRIHCVYKVK